MTRGHWRRMMGQLATARARRGFHKSASGLWLPPDATGVAEWWRADLGVTDAGGGAVSDWTGQIAGETVSQGTAAARPTLTTRDGQSVLSFDGGDALVGAFSTIGLIAQPLTAVIVVEITGGNPIQWVFDGNDSGNRVLLGISGGQDRLLATTTLGATVVAGEKCVVGVANGTSSKLYQNDLTTPSVTGDAGTNGTDGLTVSGDFTGGNRLTGYLWELILIDQEITSADMASLGAYLDARYAGLSLTY